MWISTLKSWAWCWRLLLKTGALDVQTFDKMNSQLWKGLSLCFWYQISNWCLCVPFPNWPAWVFIAQRWQSDFVRYTWKIICCFNFSLPFDRYAEVVPSGESSQKLAEMARLSKVWLVGGSFPERCSDTGRLYNTSLTFAPDGRQVACLRKLHLFDIDIPGRITFKESESLTAGNRLQMVDTGFCRFGLGICYDARFPDLAQLYADRGCQLLLYPGAFNMTTGPAHWELLCRARALDNELFCAFCSPARDPDASYQVKKHRCLPVTVHTTCPQVVATLLRKFAFSGTHFVAICFIFDLYEKARW